MLLTIEQVDFLHWLVETRERGKVIVKCRVCHRHMALTPVQAETAEGVRAVCGRCFEKGGV